MAAGYSFCASASVDYSTVSHEDFIDSHNSKSHFEVTRLTGGCHDTLENATTFADCLLMNNDPAKQLPSAAASPQFMYAGLWFLTLATVLFSVRIVIVVWMKPDNVRGFGGMQHDCRGFDQVFFPITWIVSGLGILGLAICGREYFRAARTN